MRRRNASCIGTGVYAADEGVPAAASATTRVRAAPSAKGSRRAPRSPVELRSSSSWRRRAYGSALTTNPSRPSKLEASRSWAARSAAAIRSGAGPYRLVVADVRRSTDRASNPLPMMTHGIGSNVMFCRFADDPAVPSGRVPCERVAQFGGSPSHQARLRPRSSRSRSCQAAVAAAALRRRHRRHHQSCSVPTGTVSVSIVVSG